MEREQKDTSDRRSTGKSPRLFPGGSSEAECREVPDPSPPDSTDVLPLCNLPS